MKTDAYEKYEGELYRMSRSATRGEPKNLVRGIADAHSDQDGFGDIVASNHKHYQRTTTTLLQAFLGGVSPPNLEGFQDTLVGFHRWGAKIASLLNRHREKINDHMKFQF